jgi:predicted lipoprotein with Yx(FWY)xxD motif
MNLRPAFVPAFFAGAAILFVVFVLALFLSGGVEPTPPATAAAAVDRETSLPTVEVGASDYGPMLFDGRGYALYAFTSDPSNESVCTAECADAWPPYVAVGDLRAGEGVRQTLLGTVERPDGTVQVAYAGRPLYHYVGDGEPGQVLCQNVVEFGGTWLVVRGDGRLVR